MEGQVEINKEAGRKGADGVSETARHRIRACLWILTILTCVMIFAFSSQDGDTSMETSGLLAEPIARAIARLRPDMTQNEYQVLLDGVQAVVRKTAHFSEYALLGGLICLLLVSYYRPHPVPGGCLLGGLYACTDELHQYLSGSRTGMALDVLLDTCGALAGAALAFFVGLKLYRKWRLQRPA